MLNLVSTVFIMAHTYDFIRHLIDEYVDNKPLKLHTMFCFHYLKVSRFCYPHIYEPFFLLPLSQLHTLASQDTKPFNFAKICRRIPRFFTSATLQ